MKVPNAKGGDAPRPAGKAAPSRCQRKCRKSYSNTRTHIYIHTYTHFYEPQLSERSELPAAWPPCPTSPPPQKGVGGVGGRGKQFAAAAAVFLFILFSVILLCDPSVDFMYLFMGKLGKWLSLHFPSLSRSRALSRPLRQGAKGCNYEVYTPFAQAGLPQRLQPLPASPNFLLGLSISFLATPN